MNNAKFLLQDFFFLPIEVIYTLSEMKADNAPVCVSFLWYHLHFFKTAQLRTWMKASTCCALITNEEAMSAQIFNYVKGKKKKSTFFNLKPRHSDKPWKSAICTCTAIYPTLN